MRIPGIFAALLMAYLFSLQPSSPAIAATEAIGVNATIMASVGLVEVRPLSFGTVLIGADAGSITIDPSDSISNLNNVMSDGNATAALVEITAEPGLQLLASTESSVILDSGSNTMVVDHFTIGDAANGDTTTLTLTSPSEQIMIGATLQVGAGQPPGVYTGSFDFTVNYQ